MLQASRVRFLDPLWTRHHDAREQAVKARLASKRVSLPIRERRERQSAVKHSLQHRATLRRGLTQ